MLLKNKSNKLSILIRSFLLYFIIIFFIIFLSLPIKFFSSIVIFPNIASILIFYFLIIKAESVNYFAIFLLGILFDIFNGLPIGGTSLILLLSSKFIIFLRTHLYTPDNFIVNFRDFSIYEFINIVLQWITFSVIYRIPFPVSNLFIQLVLDLAFFAILYKLLKKIEESLF